MGHSVLLWGSPYLSNSVSVSPAVLLCSSRECFHHTPLPVPLGTLIHTPSSLPSPCLLLLSPQPPSKGQPLSPQEGASGYTHPESTPSCPLLLAPSTFTPIPFLLECPAAQTGDVFYSLLQQHCLSPGQLALLLQSTLLPPSLQPPAAAQCKTTLSY